MHIPDQALQLYLELAPITVCFQHTDSIHHRRSLELAPIPAAIITTAAAAGRTMRPANQHGERLRLTGGGAL